MPKEIIIKCKATVEKHGKDRICDRFIMKFINGRKQIHSKCPSCGSYVIITANGNDFDIVHLREGEEVICQS